MFTGCLIALLVWLLIEVISSFIIIGLYAAVAALLGLVFSWKVAWVIVIIWAMLSSLFRMAAGKKE